MPCNCTNPTSICVFVNPCNSGTLIGITPETGESGTWTGRIEFNGGWTEFSVEVEAGEEISILTTLLNENYVHELILTNISGDETCYKLRTQYSRNASGAPVLPVGTWDWACIEANGNTVTSPYLAGEIAPILYMGAGGDINWDENGITHDAETETLDLTAIGGFVGVICLQYRNLP